MLTVSSCGALKSRTFMLLAVMLLVQQQQLQAYGLQENHTHQKPPTEVVQPLQQQAQIEQLSRNNFLVGIAKVGSQLANGTTQCGKELEQLLKAVDARESWSMKALDSFGAAPRSFSWGNYFWFSARELCDDLNAPFRISFSPREQQRSGNLFNVTAPFALRFWMVYFKFDTPHFIDIKLPFENLINIGLCLPRSCSTSQVFQYSDAYFKSEIFETQQIFKIKMQATDIKTPEFKWSFFQQSGSITYIIICLVAIFLIITAELVHKSKENLKLQLQMHQKTTAAPPPPPPPTTTTTTTDATIPTPNTKSTTTETSTIEEIILCFRLSENYKRLWRLESSDNFLSVIAGIRTIICLWVTVFHVYYYSLFAMRNTPMIFAKLENFALQPVTQSCFYVDVFFVISAFLLVYNFLSNENYVLKIRANSFLENCKLFAKTVLHRYLRLTPVLIATMLMSDMIFDFLNMFSPFRLDMNSGIYCKNNWWYNLLYINNFLDMKDICCSWTWYLSCEMQYFMLFTALLFVYAKNEKLAKNLFALITCGFLIASFLCNYYHGITFQIDIIYTTLDQLYVKPWVRITPYLGGAYLGWLWHKHQDQSTKLYKLATKSSWTLTFWFGFALIYAATNFMTCWRSAPSWLVSIIMSFGKLLFALWVGGVIIMCAWGRGGLFNTLMSARPFLFLNKFCYSIYMIAPVIVFTTFGARLETTSFTEVASGMDFMAIILIAIGTSFIMVLIVEIPMQRFSSRFLKKS